MARRGDRLCTVKQKANRKLRFRFAFCFTVPTAMAHDHSPFFLFDVATETTDLTRTPFFCRNLR